MIKIIFNICAIIALFIACNNDNKIHIDTSSTVTVQVDSIMNNAEEYSNYDCDLSYAMTLGYGSWAKAGLSELKYAFYNFPAGVDTTQIKQLVRLAWSAWEEHLGMPIRYTDKVSEANIIIEWSYLDGIGKKMAVAESPPADLKDRKQIYLTYDEYDFRAQRRDYNFFACSLHEQGHTLGLMHSDEEESVMYHLPDPRKKKLTIDDAAGIRLRYGRIGDFTFEGHKYIAIHKNGTRRISKNFVEKEFWTTCHTYRQQTLWLSKAVIDGLQKIRDVIGVPMRITSCYRNQICNEEKNGAPLSQHKYMSAADFIFIKDQWNAKIAYEKDIILRGLLFRQLYDIGIRGFGSYNNGSFHIDARTKYFCDWWYGKPLCVWGRLNRGYGMPISEEIHCD